VTGIKALLLDVGGVLLQPMEPVQATYRRLGQGYGVKKVNFALGFGSAQGRQLMVGRPFWREVVGLATGCWDRDYFESLYAYFARAEAWMLAPGAGELIARLRQDGTKVGIVSNWDTRLRGTLEALGLEVDGVFCSGELGVEKPDSRLFGLACRTLGVTPSQALHVGDSLRCDVEGARAAGLSALHFGVEVADFAALSRHLFPPWQPTHPVSLAQAQELKDAVFPDFPGLLTPLGQGWDNQVFALGQDKVLRIPHRHAGAQCMAAELEVLPHLALPGIPRVLGRGQTLGHPFELMLQERIPGQSVELAALDAAQRGALAAPLGAWMRRLHAQEPRGAAPDTWGRLDPERLGKAISEKGRWAVAEGLLSEAPQVDLVEADDTLALCHGDLYCRHVLVDARGAFSGVIDWGDVHLGHPAIDIAGALSILPPKALPCFFESYGKVSQETLVLARMRAVHSALTLLHFGHSIGDAPLLAEAKLALRHLLEPAY
jgi:REG-2-like HAD superfamily hydrolase